MFGEWHARSIQHWLLGAGGSAPVSLCVVPQPPGWPILVCSSCPPWTRCCLRCARWWRCSFFERCGCF
jgi:hypothetical protein